MTLCIILAAIHFAPAAIGLRAAHAGGFRIVEIGQVTASGLNPQVSGSRVVWESPGGTDFGSDREVFLFDRGVTTQLTTNAIHDLNPRVSSTGVLWERNTGNNAEIYFHNGLVETPLTNNVLRDMSVSLSGHRAAWIQGSGFGLDVVLWDGSNPAVSLTGSLPPVDTADTQVSVNGNNTVWVRGSTPNQSIMKYDGTNITPIATSSYAMADPVADGDWVAWEGFKDRDPSPLTSDREIYLHNGISSDPLNISDNDHPDFDPQISAGRIVWWGGTFNDNQVFLWEDGVARPLSASGLNQFPKINGQVVVWQGWEGFGGGDMEIFLWDGMQVHQITDNDFDDTMPQISGNLIVWQAEGGVYHATFAIPEPASLALAAMGMAACVGARWRRRRRVSAMRESRGLMREESWWAGAGSAGIDGSLEATLD